MSECPSDLRYSKSHEWVRIGDDNTVTVGITDHAQCQLGDLVFVDLPEVDLAINAGDEVAVVESVKTAADIYAPLAGSVIEVNAELDAEPSAVNQEPYGKGWLFRVKANDLSELDNLMSAEDYAKTIED